MAVARRTPAGVRHGRLSLESWPQPFPFGRVGWGRLSLFLSYFLVLAFTVVMFAGTREASSPSAVPSPVASHNLAPVISNQWYSNLLAQFPTQPLFALPGAYQLSPQGMGVSLPVVTKSPATIFAPYRTELLLGFGALLGKPKLTAIGDWSVGLSMTSASGSEVHFTLAHGVPFTVLHSTGTRLSVTCAVACAAFVDNVTPIRAGVAVTATAVSLTVGVHAYVLVFDHGAQVRFDGHTLLADRVSRVFLGMLDSRSHYQVFRDVAGAEVLGTEATPQLSVNQLTTTYAVTGTGPTPLLALYPHLLKSLAAPLPVIGTYPTIRGTLSLVRASSFVTVLPVQRPPAAFPVLAAVPADLSAALHGDISAFIQGGLPNSGDYFLGVWLGRGIDLMQLAGSTGMSAESARLLHYLEPILDAALKGFYYDAALTSVIARRPEFGNEKLNDHHFHYGYYIRAAAVLSAADPAYLPQVRDSVNAMVGDIATSVRSSTRYPYLRNFDVYEGHSWADGFAKFADGNNQESSSEAISAWYAVYLWSQVTGDARLAVTGLYMYTTEVQSVKEYWFGGNGLYSPPYQHRIASLVWGGKVDFATWFSGNPNAIYGIQLLPVTPASGYLGKLAGIDPYLVDLRASGGSVTGFWGDLLLTWESYYFPQAALASAPMVRAADLNGPRSLFLYMLYRSLRS